MKVAKVRGAIRKKTNSHKGKFQMHSVSWKTAEVVRFNGRIRGFVTREGWE